MGYLDSAQTRTLRVIIPPRRARLRFDSSGPCCYNCGPRRSEPITREESVIPKEEALEFIGTVTAVLGNSNFRVELENGHEVLATIAGKMRRFRIRVLEGDRVTIEVSPYDLNRGRISYRHKS